MMLVAMTDSLDLAWIADRLPAAPPHTLDLCWYLPMILVSFACRSRLLGPTADRPGPPIEEDEQVRGVPLLVYSLVFAVIHLMISLLQPSHGPLDEARTVLVIFFLVVFTALNIGQNAVIDRIVRKQSLRRLDAEAQIRTLSRLDPLTDLLNRRALENELARAVARAERTGLSLALMFIDLDDFKVVNDTYGHSAGDGVIYEAAARLKVCTREVDTLARYGGDEFVLVLEAVDGAADAETVAARILEAFGLGFQHESQRIQLSASIGVALFPADGRSPQQLIETADRAMYRVKQAGGGGMRTADAVGAPLIAAEFGRRAASD
jgi:diguanylate cyclase (GGDEF)-like protein